MDKEYINPNNPVYFSYAWANPDNPNLEKDVDNLCQLLDDNNIYYKRDKTNLCPYRWSINKAEEEIGEGSVIIVVISKRYIESLHCMNEWHMIRENGRIWERVFPIVLEDGNVADEKVFDSFYDYFETRKTEILEKQKKGRILLSKVEGQAAETGFFIHDLQILNKYLCDYNHSKISLLRENNYGIIIEQLKAIINEIKKKSQDSIPKQQDVKPIIPHFSLSLPDGLLHRDNEEEKLYGLISRNRIVNLVGAGGSGKSSLANLCLVKHKNDFNEIAYVVVNNNIKDDFVEQINRTLKIDIKNDPVRQNDNALKLENKNDFGEQLNKTSNQKISDDVYSIIISYLQENYKAEKQNLLVLDINETSDKNKNAEIIEGIIKNNIFLDSWKFLILSREKVDTRRRIKSYNLDDIEDTEFLKELFLEKVGNRYNDFDDFQELFKAIYYNPLLTEQLGYYLKRQPKVLTINEITSIFNRDSFKEMEMNGLSAQRHDEKIISFLKKIIIFV